MPIKLQINHPDRMIVGIVRGTVTLQDLDGFAAEIRTANAAHYRKIIDVMGAVSGPTNEDLAAFSERVRPPPPGSRRGPIAVVAGEEHGPLVRLFAELMGDERPVQVFASIHAARRWLDENSRNS